MKKSEQTKSQNGNGNATTQVPKVKNSLNYSTSDGRVFTQPSMTVPDQTISIKELVNRFTQGLPIPVGKTPIYDESGEAEGIDLKKLDLSEIHNMAKDVQWKLEKAQKAAEKSKQKESKLEIPEGQ